MVRAVEATTANRKKTVPASHRNFSQWLLVTCAVSALNTGLATAAEQTAAEGNGVSTQTAASGIEEIVVTVERTTRSAVDLGGAEVQRILPGTNSLKAIQMLPGVDFETADPWGNNEQNETLYIHGFSLQQLGYTMDGVPLGDQQYGNWNGLSPSRALISENISRVSLSSGAGDLGTASASNLGGTIETFSIDPAHTRGGYIQETLGSYDTTRTFARLDTGAFGGENYLSASGLYHDAKAWDFDGHQRDAQANAKFVHESENGKFTFFFDYSDKVEPNEDSIVHDAADPNPPYTRPFLYPNLTAALNYLSVAGAPPASAGNNFSNYHSAAQRTDYLAYAKYDYKFNDNMSWSTTAYYHNDAARGIVAGPVNQAGLPALFSVYYPNQNLINVFGGTGYAVRTTEYTINREGVISTFKWTLGDHDLEAGGWYEYNHSTQYRRWYPFAASSTDLTPYDRPTNFNFTQYAGSGITRDAQFHLQDQWHAMSDLVLQAGFKSSLQWADGKVLVQQLNLPTSTNPTLYPNGSIDTLEGFLPQAGATYDFDGHEQGFVNVQKNLRQYINYIAAGLSPWSLGSQAAFDLFKQTVKPETSWTYETGLRTKRDLDMGFITGIDGQISYYHVEFSNRLLQISSTPVILSLVSGSSILANVGSVKTDGVDAAVTLHFGPHFSFYDTISYNRSVYEDNYTTGATNAVVPTAGKLVPDDPSWVNKFIARLDLGSFSGELQGDYVGKRFATYTNDLYVNSYFLIGAQAEYRVGPAVSWFKDVTLRLNVTNLTDKKGWGTVVVGAASGTYNTYPIPPRMVFGTLSASF